MATVPVTRRATGVTPDSDVAEVLSQFNKASRYWVLNSAIALSGVTYSASAFMIFASGSTRFFAASTGAGFTGLTIATGNVAVAVVYVGTGGTHAVTMSASAATFGAVTLPTDVVASSYVIGAILIKASGASAFTGGTTVLDGTNASAVFVNLNGPSGIAVQTAGIVLVPG